jgi:tetratricopeptide (TPR) repeat protein
VLKTLSFTVVLVICSLQSDLVSAQTRNRQTQPRARANHVENPPVVSGETASETNRRAVSPEAIAEARRLYEEGVKYAGAGLFRQAAELFRRSVKLSPDYTDAYQGLGRAYFKMRRWEEAIQSLQQALALNPWDKEARGLIDRAQLMMQETGSSEEKAVGARPEPHTFTTLNCKGPGE